MEIFENIISYVSNCSFPEKPSVIPNSWGRVVFWVAACIFGVTGIASNALSLVVYLAYKNGRTDSSLRRLLLYLSFSEIVYITFRFIWDICFGIVSNFGNLGPWWSLHLVIYSYKISEIFRESFLGLRNYCVAMIAFARVEAILFPFRARRGKSFFSKRLVMCYYILILLICLSFNIWEVSEFYIDICSHTPWLEKFYVKVDYGVLPLSPVIIYGQPIFHEIVPPIVVTLSAIIISVSLYRQSKSVQRSTDLQYLSVVKMVLLLSGAFFVFENVSILRIIGCQFFWSGASCIVANRMSHVAKLLDSNFNFIAYISCDAVFRKICLEKLCRARTDEGQVTSVASKTIDTTSQRQITK